MNVVTVIIWIALGIICAVIHKNKGYSPIAGFCWGFFLSIIGLIVVLLEKSKEEKEMSGEQGLKMWQWLLIFLGIGIILIIIFMFIISRPKDKLSSQYQNQENTSIELSNRKLDINYSSNTNINNNFENIENLYYYIKNNNWKLSSDYKSSRAYLNSKDNMFLAISCKDISDEDIENYVTDRFKYSSSNNLVESKKVNINNNKWNMFNYYDGTG